MQDGLRRIYPRKEGKRTHKKVACCVLGGISRADLIKRGSGRWNEWQARTLLRCSRVDSQMLKLEEQSRAEQSRARTKHRQGRGVNRFKAHENEWVSKAVSPGSCSGPRRRGSWRRARSQGCAIGPTRNSHFGAKWSDHQPLKSLPAGSRSPGEDVAHGIGSLATGQGSISVSVPFGLARGWDSRTAKDS
jgi:hypothetical protein